MGSAAGLGFVFGLLEDAFSILAFGANTIAMTLVGAIGEGELHLLDPVLEARLRGQDPELDEPHRLLVGAVAFRVLRPAVRERHDLRPAGLQRAAVAERVGMISDMAAMVEESRGVFTPDSGLGYEMEGAMVSMQGAADALRALALSLERNPDMLLRGKKPDAQ